MVHVIVQVTAESWKKHLLMNETRTSQSSTTDTHQINKFALNKTKTGCLLTVNESDLSLLEQLAESKVVHLTELNFQFASNISNSVFTKWRWWWMDRIGQEILSLLEMKDIFVHWTLDVGRETAGVKLLDDPPGCTINENDPGKFIAVTVLKLLSFNRKKEMCFDRVSNQSTQTICCKITGRSRKKDPWSWKSQCYVSVAARSEFVNILETMLSVYEYCLPVTGIALVVYFGIFLQWKNKNNDNYYKLTESPMSLSSILSMLFWDGYGKFKSFVRRCLFMVVLGLLFRQTKYFSYILFTVYFLLWVVLFPFSSLFKRLEGTDQLHNILKPFRLSSWFLEVFSALDHDINDIYLSARVNFLGAVNLITLPFNIKRWKTSLLTFSQHNTPQTVEYSVLKKALLHFKTGVLCLGYVFFIFIMNVGFILVFMLNCYYSVIVKHVGTIASKTQSKFRLYTSSMQEGACLFLTLYFLSSSLKIIPYILISLLSGLALNVVYFFPYIVFISVLIFYSWMFWKAVEQQYVVLLKSIFDSNEDDDSNHNNNDNNNTNSYSQSDIDGHSKIVCVVSKEVYDKVRERLLPYHGSLSCFALKIFCISLFSYIMLTLVRILQANDVSPTVQVLTTFGVSAFPYIMNMVAAKKGEEQNDAWKEQIKRRVKPLVHGLTANNPELGRTQLIIPHRLVDSNVEIALVQESTV